MRKAQTSAIPSKWIKEYKDVLETPTWNYVHRIIIDDVAYVHGIGSKAHIKAQKNFFSTVQGHHHTECYTQWFVGKKEKFFGMQVGCGIDFSSYSFAYAKAGKKPAIACAVILDNGTVPINLLMSL